METHLAAQSESPSALRISHLSKTFPGQMALVDVDFEVRRGEIHALIGQNGSGKSTLIKILSGYHKPDPGSEAELDGVPVQLGQLTDREQSLVRFVHQDLALVGSLTVYENLLLEDPGRRALAHLSGRQMRLRARKILADLGWDIDVNRRVEDLAPFERATVAIARALGVTQGAALLVLDEPTVAIGKAEVEQMFVLLRNMRARGLGIVYVSHVLEEVLAIADRVSVLRDGHMVGTFDLAGLTEADLVSAMLGRALADVHVESEVVRRQPIMSVVGVRAPEFSEPLSFDLHEGEVLGLTGLQGSGYEAVPHYLVGSRRWDRGEFQLDGRVVTAPTPWSCLQAGVAMMPSDRRSLGIIPTLTIRENMTLPALRAFGPVGPISIRSERNDVRDWLGRMTVSPADPERLVGELSGGNQQKVMLAKWLRCDPKVMILDEPSQAVDVGAKTAIEQLVLELASQGRSIMIISNEAADLARLCHRVLIFRAGRVAEELSGVRLTKHELVTRTLASTTTEKVLHG